MYAIVKTAPGSFLLGWSLVTQLSGRLPYPPLLKHDPTINQIHQLSYGWRAWRVDRNSEWVTEEVDSKVQEE